MNYKKAVSWLLTVAMVFPYFSITLSSAQEPDKGLNQEEVKHSTQQFYDTTGEVFETKEVTQTENIAASGEETRGTSLDSQSGLQVEPDYHGRADAEGVILRLKDDSLLKFKDKAEKAGDSPAAVKTSLATQLGNLKIQHAQVLKKIAKLINRDLVRGKIKKDSQIQYTEYFSTINAIVLEGVPVKASISQIKMAEISSVEPNYRVKASLSESVPMTGADQVWPLISAGGSLLDGSGMRVGIIDTGIDYTHPDLGGCFGPGCKVEGGYDYVNGDTDPMDDHGHGTHVAATAAGNGTYVNSSGDHPLPGVAPGANIYGYKVLGASGSGYSSSIIAAIEACADPNGDLNYTDHLDVCSMSLGGTGDPDDPMSEAVDTASNNGTVFTIAAGNNGPEANTVASPGTSRSAITVAAAFKNSANSSDPIASFSSRGPVSWVDPSGASQTIDKPDIAAPGVDICAAAWSNWKTSWCLDNSHISISGTSMATPHVAGAAVLLRQAHPELSPVEIKDMLKSSAHDLGAPEYAQGSGMVDINAAVNMAGLPQSLVKVTNLPLLFNDPATTSKYTVSKTLTLQNITTETIEYAPSLINAGSGMTATFDKTKIILNPGEQTSLLVRVDIDNLIAKSPSNITGTLRLATLLGNADIAIRVIVSDRLSANPNSVYLGLDNPSLSAWTANKSISLQNLMTDAPATYSASLNFSDSNITASLDKNSVTVAAGGSATLGMNITANNAQMSNKKYSGVLNLTSANQNLSIPVYFYKGYSFKFVYNSTPPNDIFMHNGLNLYNITPAAGATEEQVIVYNPGPYDAYGRWDGDSVALGYEVVRTDISTVPGTELVSMVKSDAKNALSFKSPKVNGSEILVQSSFEIYVTNISSGYNDRIAGFYSQSGSNFMVNDIPGESGDHSFSIQYTGEDEDNALYVYNFRFPNGIYSSQSLQPNPSEFIKRNIIGYQNQQLAQTPEVRIAPVTPQYTVRPGENRFRDYITFSTTMTSKGAISLPAGTSKPLYIYNNIDDDVSALAYPNALAYRLDYGVPGNWNAIYETPDIVSNHSGDFALSGRYQELWGQINKPLALGKLYDTYSTDPSSAGTITLGAAPMFTSAAWHNYANNNNSFLSFRDEKSPLQRWGDTSDESELFQNISSAYSLSRDGSQIASGLVTYRDRNETNDYQLPVGDDGLSIPGDYKFNISRNTPINGVMTHTASESSFKIVDDAAQKIKPVDENPPALREVRLSSSSVAQNSIDPTANNKISFRISPMAGLLSAMPEFYWMNPPAYNLMADKLTAVTLEESSDGINFQTISYNNYADDSFTANVVNDPASSIYTFRITAFDLAGNRLVESFQVPAGTCQTIMEADNSAPSVAISDPSDGQVVSKTVPVNILASDNVALSRVELYSGSSIIGSKTAAPYTIDWNTTKADGDMSLWAKAYDSAGNYQISTPVKVTVQNEPPDIQPPTVIISSPTLGQVVTGTVSVAVGATDNKVVTKVELYAGNTLYSTKTASPYTFAWNTTGYPAGYVTLKARAYDAAGNTADSVVTVVVKDNIVPQVSITAPTNGAVVIPKQNMQISASATDNIGIAKVEFYINNTRKSIVTTAPYRYLWKVPTARKTTYTITVKAYDAAGNVAQSAITVKTL